MQPQIRSVDGVETDRSAVLLEMKFGGAGFRCFTCGKVNDLSHGVRRQDGRWGEIWCPVPFVILIHLLVDSRLDRMVSLAGEMCEHVGATTQGFRVWTMFMDDHVVLVWLLVDLRVLH